MRKVFRARWVLPVEQPPIRDGWVATEQQSISGVGGPDTCPADARDVPIIDAVILPGLVNAHTHLELSWMRDQVAPASSMPRWVERLMALRRTVGHEPPRAIVEAIAEARAAGTTLVGDITNTLAACPPLAGSQISAAVFRELLGFNVPDPHALVDAVQRELDALVPAGSLRPSIVPHAPYSVSPGLLRAIAAASAGRPVSIHLAESAEEMEFLQTGTGAWRDLLTTLQVWNESWSPPGCSPVDYIEQHGLVNDRLVAVHCVQLGEADLHKLARAGATVVTCPRSNRWTGAGRPPVELFYASGVRVAIGTDSLASVEDLNLFAELALLRELAPSISARALLASATLNGAVALGFGEQLGSIEAGKRAELIAIDVPAAVSDVEEYLVSGITPDRIQWLV
jgi:cytosine/adenosine deaminase-related metal-dependent hydrolase